MKAVALLDMFETLHRLTVFICQSSKTPLIFAKERVLNKANTWCSLFNAFIKILKSPSLMYNDGIILFFFSYEIDILIQCCYRPLSEFFYPAGTFSCNHVIERTENIPAELLKSGWNISC